jgi:hypothetical protein
MRWSGALVAAVLLAASSGADAAPYILGDSIGDGVAVTNGQHNLAHIGIHIRGPKAIEQIAQTPPGSTVYIFLGTNDAEGSIKNIDKSVDDVMAAASRRQLRVIWLGPHCVRKSWDAQARELDRILRAHFAGTAIKYVSTRDPRICSGTYHEPDGVHLTAKGYRILWELARSADGDSADTRTAALPARDDGAAANVVLPHLLVMEIHVPSSGSGPLVWTRATN